MLLQGTYHNSVAESGYITAPVALFYDTAITAEALRLYLLLKHSEEDPFTEMRSIKGLAHRFNLPEETVRCGLRNLEEIGLLRVSAKTVGTLKVHLISPHDLYEDRGLPQCPYIGTSTVERSEAMLFNHPRKPSAPSPAKRFRVLERDGFICQYCGRGAPEVELHVDHIIPLSANGTNDDSNLITSCQKCNAGKGNIVLDTESLELIKCKANQNE